MEQHTPDQEESKKGSVISEILSWVEVLVIAVIAALCINTFIIANSTVPTGSMEDTIEQGDRVIGLRLTYTFGKPEKGDVAIFKFGWICRSCSAQGEGTAPDNCPSCGSSLAFHKTLYYVKRIIAGPGDTVSIVSDGSVRQGDLASAADIGLDMSRGDEAELMTAAVYVNGEKLDEPYLREPMLYTGDMEFEVPEGCYFFMGDNRNNSLDARYWSNPYIAEDKLIAKVYFRYFPTQAWID